MSSSKRSRFLIGFMLADYRLTPLRTTPAQAAALERVDLACKELRPIEDKHYLERTVNRQVGPIFSRHKVMGFLIPEEYGVLGMDVPLYVWAIERVGQEGTSPRTFFSCHLSIGASVISYWGNDEQKRRYLPQAASGERVFGFGLTEPE